MSDRPEAKFSVRRYAPSDAVAWNSFAAGARNRSFLFNRSYMDYHQDRLVDHSLIITLDGRVFALLPANQAERQLASHGGLTFGGLLVMKDARLVHVMEIFRSIASYGRSQGLAGLTYRPAPHCYHIVPTQEDIVALHLLGASVSDIRATSVLQLPLEVRPTDSRKGEVERALRNGVEAGPDDDVIGFMELCGESLRQRYGVSPVHTPAEIDMLARRFPDDIVLLAARRNRKLIAGILLYENEACTRAQYIASTEEARRLGAVSLLMEAMIKRAEGRHRWLDLGTSVRPEDGSLNLDLMFAKESYGARTAAQMAFNLDF